MRLIAIDPGTTESAWVVYEPFPSSMIGRVLAHGHEPNSDVLWSLRNNEHDADALTIEKIASYGMAVGAEVFDTCIWIGRFDEAWATSSIPHRRPARLVYRRDVKLHLCGQSRAKDPNVRQAILDLYGGKAAAMGRKAARGPLYGVSGDVWSALAVAITASNVAPNALPIAAPNEIARPA